MKKSVICVLLLALCFYANFLSFASAYINASNISVRDRYSPYDNFSGTFYLNITGVDSNLNISSELGSMNLKQFLELNNLGYECNPSDCLSSYRFNGGESAKTISYPSENLFGFVLEGDGVSLIDLKFELLSDFGTRNELPLKLIFFDNEIEWKYNKASEDYTKEISYGCYDGSQQSAGNTINQNLVYCENVNISDDAPSVIIGADFARTDSVNNVTMKIKTSDLGDIGYCTINSTNRECKVNYYFNKSSYFVCASSSFNTSYELYSETNGRRCGYRKQANDLGSIFGSNSTTDYSLYVKTPKYAAALNMSFNSSYLDMLNIARSYLSSKYSNNCTGLWKCVLPVKIFGVNQNARVFGASLSYLANGVPNAQTSNIDKIYGLSETPSKISFNGEVDLSLLGFNVSAKGNKTIHFKLGNNDLFEKRILVLPAPIINSVAPLTVPAGVLVNFITNVSAENNISSYNWDFGDSTTETTGRNMVKHVYSNITSYVLTLSVTDSKNLTSSKQFTVSTISPRESINTTLISKRNSLEKAMRDIAGFPVWQQNKLNSLVNISFYQDELRRLDNANNNSYEDSQFLSIALDLYNLNFPYSVYINKSVTSPLILDDLNKININAVQAIGGGSETDLEKYRDGIYQWQTENFNSTIIFRDIALMNENQILSPLIYSYEIRAKSNFDGESYFIINKNKDDIVFKNEDLSYKKAGNDAAGIVFNENEEKSIEFYTLEPVSFFASTRLGLLPFSVSVENCNNNKECEEGETNANCPDDCKTIWKPLLYSFLALIFGIIIYTIVQIWYNTKYESHLFKDRKYVYNLLMFISNARARGLRDDQIRVELKKQNWSNEQITYVLKKSRGEKTGMFEIIPLSKLSASQRDKRAVEKLNKDSKIVAWG